MEVSTTHRINLSMWILIYSFSDTYYVWAACAIIGRALGGSTVLDLPLFYSLSLFFIVLLPPLLSLLIYIYLYMYTCSFIVHILPPFVDLYMFIAYSTLNIVSFVYVYIYLSIYLFFEGRRLENCNRLLRFPL